MATTYAQLTKQIEALKQEAEAQRAKELSDVVKKMKEAIAVYGLTAADLGFGPAKSTGTSKSAKGKGGQGAKFRDDAGNAWSGRGPRPGWLKAALAAGKQLSDFAA
jgi:DNA-binding protein H-NS